MPSILSIVEEIQRQQLILDPEEIYNPKFWLPIIPLKVKRFERIAPFEFEFAIDDDIQLDATGLLTTRYISEGIMNIDYKGEQKSKDHLWILDINVKSPEAKVLVNVRARNLKSKNAIKMGIFIQKLEFSDTLLDGFGRDAVMFAIRVYIRNLLRAAGNRSEI
ncbi:MAG: hypothetical protein ACTSWL_00695 [Promethearchaeota archaeon]